MQEIQMVDLRTQYHRIQTEIQQAILACLESSAFIKGPEVSAFEEEFAEFQGAKHVVSCGNGTDALQLALMGLGLQPGDEVIVPAFTYIATAEVIALLGLTPVMVDVDPETFNVTAAHIATAITHKTRAIVPVHLYGQCAEMEEILRVADEHKIPVVEDAAQATGSVYRFRDGTEKKAGAIGRVGCTSFFPTKNLGCYGDGGAVITDDDELASRIRKIANHGQSKKYYHDLIGVNSRLDSLQAAILRIKLRHLDSYVSARQAAALRYDDLLSGVDRIAVPKRVEASTHSFHQYTLKVKGGSRDALQAHLSSKGIPSVVYYPLPLHKQEAFAKYDLRGESLTVSETLCKEVISLPIHTELAEEVQASIVSEIRQFQGA